MAGWKRIGALFPLLCGALSAAGGAEQVRRDGRDDPAEFADRRRAMVAEQIERRGIADRAVLEAMRTVPRHRFVPGSVASLAYEDRPLPIGFGQTISQPYIVAFMTEALGVTRAHQVLEVGTGSGYQAAVLARVAGRVFTIEIVPELARRAAGTFRQLGISNVVVREGDGYAGWPSEAPFDRIMVTAAPVEIPQPLIDQLAVGGRMVIPVGGLEQWLVVVDKTRDGAVERRTIPVRFVPLTRAPR